MNRNVEIFYRVQTVAHVRDSRWWGGWWGQNGGGGGSGDKDQVTMATADRGIRIRFYNCPNRATCHDSVLLLFVMNLDWARAFFKFMWSLASLVFFYLFRAFLYAFIASLQSLFHQGTIFFFVCVLVLPMVLLAASSIMLQKWWIIRLIWIWLVANSRLIGVSLRFCDIISL